MESYWSRNLSTILLGLPWVFRNCLWDRILWFITVCFQISRRGLRCKSRRPVTSERFACSESLSGCASASWVDVDASRFSIAGEPLPSKSPYSFVFRIPNFQSRRQLWALKHQHPLVWYHDGCAFYEGRQSWGFTIERCCDRRQRVSLKTRKQTNETQSFLWIFCLPHILLLGDEITLNPGANNRSIK
jgi:hypothetical protein